MQNQLPDYVREAMGPATVAVDERKRCLEAMEQNKSAIEEAKTQLEAVRSDLSSEESLDLDLDEKNFIKKRNEIRGRFTECRDRVEFLEARQSGLEKRAIAAEEKLLTVFHAFDKAHTRFVQEKVQEFRDAYVKALEEHIRPLMAIGYALDSALGAKSRSIHMAFRETKIFDPVSYSEPLLKFKDQEWNREQSRNDPIPKWRGNAEAEAIYASHREAAETFSQIESLHSQLDNARRDAERQRKIKELFQKKAS